MPDPIDPIDEIIRRFGPGGEFDAPPPDDIDKIIASFGKGGEFDTAEPVATTPVAPAAARQRGHARLQELKGKLFGEPQPRPRHWYSSALDLADLAQGATEIPLAVLTHSGLPVPSVSSFSRTHIGLKPTPRKGIEEALGEYLGDPAVQRVPLEFVATGGVQGAQGLFKLLRGLTLRGAVREAAMVRTIAQARAEVRPQLVDKFAESLSTDTLAAVRAEVPPSQSLRFREPTPTLEGRLALYPEVPRAMPTRSLTDSLNLSGTSMPMHEGWIGRGRGPIVGPESFNAAALPPELNLTNDELYALARARSQKAATVPGGQVMNAEPFTMPNNEQTGEAIAARLGIKYDGVQEGIGKQFTDPVTGSTTYGDTLAEVEAKIAGMRDKFAVAEVPTERVVTPAARKQAVKVFTQLANQMAQVEKAVFDAAGPLTPTQRELFKGSDWRAFLEARGYNEAQIAQFQDYLDAYGKAKALGVSDDLLYQIGDNAYGRANGPFRPIAGGTDNNYIRPPSLMQRVRALVESAPPAPQTAEGKLLAKMRSGLSAVQPTIRENRALVTTQRAEQERVYHVAQLGPGTSEARHIAGRAAQTGQFATAEFEPLAPLFNAGERNQLYELVDAKPRMKEFEKARVKNTLHKLLDLGIVPEPNELSSFRSVFGSSLQMPMKGHVANEVLSTIKTLETSFLDISPLGRQGILSVPGHPVAGASALAKGLHAAVSVKAETRYAEALRARPNYPIYVRYDLNLTSAEADVSGREIELAGNWIFETKLPGLRQVGNVLALSKRFQYTFLNELRANVFDSYAQFLNKPDDARAMHDIAHFINASTGRGSLPKFLAENPGVVNAGVYSLRYLVSRFETPWAAAGLAAKSPKAALMLIKDFLAAAAAVGGFTALVAHNKGATVGSDIDSPDFGKIRIGNTRLDPYAGFQQDVRLIGRLGRTAQITPKAGETAAEHSKRMGRERSRILSHFVRSKLGPGISFIYDAWSGSSAVGEPVDVTDPSGAFKELVELTAPMNVIDVKEAAQAGGLKGALVAAPTEFGVGVSTYADPQQQKFRHVIPHE